VLIGEAFTSVIIVVGQRIVVRASRVGYVLLGSKLVDLELSTKDVKDVDFVATHDLGSLGERENPVSRPRLDTILLLENRV
jgi:hypothetical protein